MSSARLFTASCAIALAFALGACGQSENASQPQDSETATAPDAKPGMSLAGGQLTLPIVDGRPAGVFFELTNGGKEPVTLVSAYVEGAASAEIHETAGGTMKKRESIEVAPGATLTFARGGLHVMAFDLSEDLTEGGTTEMTLTFSDGDKLSAPIEIVSGAMDHDMQGMEH